MLIHVSGPPGSGKTTLGNELKKYFKSKAVVKDLDDLFGEFIKLVGVKNFDNKKYQTYIDNFILSCSKKPLVLVGLNSDPLTKHYYTIHPNYAYCIDLPININLERLFMRDITGWIDWMDERPKDILFKQLAENEKEVISGLTNSLARTLRISEHKKAIIGFRARYVKEKYQFLTYAQIYKKILSLIK
jgi:hypothetical protein